MKSTNRTALLILGLLLLVLVAPLDAAKGKVPKTKKVSKNKKAGKAKSPKNKRNNKGKRPKNIKKKGKKAKSNKVDPLSINTEYGVAFLQNQLVPGCGLWPQNPLGNNLLVDIYFPVDYEDFDVTKLAQLNLAGAEFDLSLFGATVFDGASVPMAEGKFPLIMYGHGFGGFATENTMALMNIARSGYVVAAPSHIGSGLPEVLKAVEIGGPDAYDTFFQSVFFNRPKETQCVTNFMVDNSMVSSEIDRNNIGIFGYSTGAQSSIAASAGYSNIFPVDADPRVKAAVAMAPFTIGYPAPYYPGKISTPLFLITSEVDDRFPPAVVEPFWELLDGVKSAYWMEFDTVNHSAFSDICIVKAAVDSLDDTDPTKAIAAPLLAFYFSGPNPIDCSFIPSPVYAPAITAFFDIHLKGMKDRKPLLSKSQYNGPAYDGVLDFKKKHNYV